MIAAVDKTDVLALLQRAALAYPGMSALAGFVERFCTVTDRIQVRVLLTAEVGVTAGGGCLELDLKLPVDLFGLARRAAVAKLLTVVAGYPAIAAAGIDARKAPNGNVWVGIRGFSVTDAGAREGTIWIQGQPGS